MAKLKTITHISWTLASRVAMVPQFAGLTGIGMGIGKYIDMACDVIVMIFFRGIEVTNTYY